MLTQVHIARILWASQPSNWDTLSIYPLQHLEAHKPLCDCQLCLKMCYYQVSHHSCTSYHGGFSWHKHFLNGKKSEIKLQTYSKYSFWEAEMLTGVIRSCGFSFLTLPEDKNNQEHFAVDQTSPAMHLHYVFRVVHISGLLLPAMFFLFAFLHSPDQQSSYMDILRISELLCFK